MNPLALLPSLPPPNQGVPASAYQGQVVTPFDFGLSSADLAAIRMALTTEMDPNHLVGFASTLAADHPVSASLLFARAELLEQRPRARRDAMMADGSHAADRLRELVDRVTGQKWSGTNTTRWISEVPIDVGRNLSELVRAEAPDHWPDVGQSFQRVSPPPVRWGRLDRLTAAAEGAEAFQRSTHDAQSTPLHYESALALAQPVPLAMAARHPTACALQAFGFHELYPRTRGLTVFDRATDFAHAVVQGHRMGFPPWVSLLIRRRMELDALVYHGGLKTEAAERAVRQAASDLIVDPRADLSDVPHEVARLARSLVIEVGPDVRVVDPMAARIALRPIPLETRSADRQRWTANYHKGAALARQQHGHL